MNVCVRSTYEWASRKTNTFVIIQLVYTIFLYSSFRQTKNQLHLFKAFLVYPIDIRCFVQYVSVPLIIASLYIVSYMLRVYCIHVVRIVYINTLLLVWRQRVEYRHGVYMQIVWTVKFYFTQNAILLLLKMFACCIFSLTSMMKTKLLFNVKYYFFIFRLNRNNF